MADNNQEIPLYNKQFLGESDSEFIDAEDIQLGLFKRTTNLTPARKIGSLVQFGGTSIFKLNGVSLSSANLPNPSGYKLVDFYSFSLDRDEMELMLLVYQNTNGYTKFYVNPFYNPDSSYSNHDYTKPVGWVHEWLELTQTFSTLVAANVSANGRLFTIDNPPAINLTGWFVWNKTKNKYHFVSVHTVSSPNVSTIGICDDFDDDDEVIFYRFPVTHYYNADIPVLNNSSYANRGNPFDALPTQFHYGLNELRMPCGKDKRPLILTDIFERKFFQDGTFTQPDGYVNSISLLTTLENLTAIPTVSFSAGNAVAQVAYMRAGDDTHTIVNAGTGFLQGDVIKTVKGQVPAEFTVTTVGVNGAITGIQLLNGGKFYGALPANPIEVVRKYQGGGGGGQDGSVIFDGDITDAPSASINLVYAIGALQIINPGSGYASTPSITISGGAGTASCTIVTVGQGTNVGIKYNGLWFDFQQIPQVLYKNAVSAFGNLAHVSNVKNLYLLTGRTTVQKPLVPASGIGIVTDYMILTWNRVELLTVAVYPYDAGTPQDTIIYSDAKLAFSLRNNNRTFVILIKTPTPPTLQEIYDAYYSGTGYGLLLGLSMTIQGTAGSSVNRYPSFDNIEYMTANTLVSSGGEAGNNLVSENRFLGTKCKVTSAGSGSIGLEKYMTPLIVSVMYDSRNEVVVANGRVLSNVPETSNYQDAFQLQFNAWFSRRITGFKIYTGETQNTSENLDLEAAVVEYKEYPWFVWTQNHYVNEFGLLKLVNIEEILTPISAQLPYQSRYSKIATAGLNCYTLDTVNNVWYTKLETTYQGINELGTGLRFMDETGRTIDQDITMNYTRITYAGEINGRYFITGVKNTIEKIVYENNDAILYSNYGAGVSQYDTFLRVKAGLTGVGTRDVNRAIAYYNGFVVIVKDTSLYYLDVNTDEDLRYRVVATQIGRGVINPDSVVFTPHGIVVPSKDSVYLINPSEAPKQILHQANGKLNWYREYFANQDLMACYSNEYDEVFIVQRATGIEEESYVMIYNFQTERWTTVAYNTNGRAGNTVHVKARVAYDKSILFLNSYGTANIVKFDEKATGYVNTAGTEEPIEFILETHKMPYGEKIFDIIPKALTLHYTATVSSSRKLKNLFTKRIGTSISSYDTIPTSETDRVANFLFPTNNAQDMLGFTLSNVDSNNTVQKFNSFILNSFIIWITKQRRLLQQT